MSELLQFYEDDTRHNQKFSAQIALLESFLQALKTQDAAMLEQYLAPDAQIESVLLPGIILNKKNYLIQVTKAEPDIFRNLRYTGVTIIQDENKTIANGIIGDHFDGLDQVTFIKYYIVEMKTATSNAWQISKTTYST